MATDCSFLLSIGLLFSLLFRACASTQEIATPGAASSFALKVNAPGTRFHELYLGKNPSTSLFGVASLNSYSADCLSFNLDNHNLVLEHHSFASTISSFSSKALIVFSGDPSSQSIWRLSNGDHGILSCNGNPFFYACGAVELANIKVGLGEAPHGCTPITFDSVESCLPVDPKIEARSSKTIYFPNYLVPVKSQSPDTAYGSVYAPQIIKGTRLEVAFDVRYGGATCELWFDLPGTHNNPGPGGAPYTLTGRANFTAQLLSGSISTSTTYNNRPAAVGDSFNFQLIEGHSLRIATFTCAQGEQQAFELSAIDDSSVDWFETASPTVGVILIQY